MYVFLKLQKKRRVSGELELFANMLVFLISSRKTPDQRDECFSVLKWFENENYIFQVDLTWK